MTLLNGKWAQVFLVWLVIAALLSASVILSGTVPVNGDDAMRLVGAMDLFKGQSWFDTTQYRDNTPYGAPMHWSRLVDAPLVALIALLTPFAQADAPLWAACVWPLLVLFAVIALLAELTERVAGAAARLPALALLALSIAIYTEFVPGRVDHHNIQIALTLAMILTTLEGRYSVRWAIAAGAVGATGLAIGTEFLPSLVAALMCFALYWIVDPQQSRVSLVAFAISFAGATAGHLLLVTPPQAWLTPACDALSATYVVAALSYAAAALAALALTPLLRGSGLRFMALAALGCAAILLVVWLFPACKGGPYGDLDADLAAVLLTEIGEALPLWVWASVAQRELALAFTPILGMVSLLAVVWLVPADKRWRWLVLAGFSLALFAVFCLQVRGFRLLTVAVIPGAAWLVANVAERFRERQTLAWAGLTALTLLAFSGATHMSISTRLIAPIPAPPDFADSWAACVDIKAFEPLRALPPSRLMSFLLIGPQLLLQTPHEIVSAGYHRNEEGLRDMIRFFGGSEADARAVAADRKLDYLIFCRGVPANNGLSGLPDFNPDLWPWLTPVSPPDAPLQIYVIDPEQ